MPPKKLPPNAFDKDGYLKGPFMGQRWAETDSESNNSLPPSPIQPSASPPSPSNNGVEFVGEKDGKNSFAQKFENAFKGKNPQGIDLTKGSQSNGKTRKRKKKKMTKITRYYQPEPKKKFRKHNNRNNRGGPGIATGTRRKRKRKRKRKKNKRSLYFRRTKNSKSKNKKQTKRQTKKQIKRRRR